jgi:hypothetical protein
MNWKRVRIWLIVTITLTVAAIVIRAIWQIVVIPTAGTMLVFIPLILAMLGAEALFVFLLARPASIKRLPFVIGFTVILSAGLLAGVSHFVRFIISENAAPFWSKVISSLVLAASLSAFGLILYVLWSFRRSK